MISEILFNKVLEATLDSNALDSTFAEYGKIEHKVQLEYYAKKMIALQWVKVCTLYGVHMTEEFKQKVIKKHKTKAISIVKDYYEQNVELINEPA